MLSALSFAVFFFSRTGVNSNDSIAHSVSIRNTQSSYTAACAGNDNPLAWCEVAVLDSLVSCNSSTKNRCNLFIGDVIEGWWNTSQVSQWHKRILGKGTIICFGRVQGFDTSRLALVGDVNAHAAGSANITDPRYSNPLANLDTGVQVGNIGTKLCDLAYAFVAKDL